MTRAAAWRTASQPAAPRGEARRIGDVAGDELDPFREALARGGPPHQEAQLVARREGGDDAATEETGRAGDQNLQAGGPPAALAATARASARASAKQVAERRFDAALRRPAEGPQARGVAAEAGHVDRPQLLRILLEAHRETREGDEARKELGDRVVLAAREVVDLPGPRSFGEPDERRHGVVDVHEVAPGREVADREDRGGTGLDRGQLRREGGQREARSLAGTDQIERAHDRGAGGERQPLGGRLGQRVGRTRRDLAALGNRLRRVRNEAVDLGARHEDARGQPRAEVTTCSTPSTLTAKYSGIRRQDSPTCESAARCTMRSGAKRSTAPESAASVADVDREADGRGRQLVLIDRHRSHRVPRGGEPRHHPATHETGRAGDEDAQRLETGLGAARGEATALYFRAMRWRQ